MSLLSFLGLVSKAEPLLVGAPAPDVAVQDESGQRLSLANIYQRGLTLIYFYPKSGTPLCTQQACSLRDGMESLQKIGVTVLGVSGDSPRAQKRFKEKHQLPFTVLADTGGALTKAFGVPVMPFGIPLRHSFLVQDGRIAWRSLSPRASAHAEEVRKAVAALT